MDGLERLTVFLPTQIGPAEGPCLDGAAMVDLVGGRGVSVQPRKDVPLPMPDDRRQLKSR